MDHGMQPERDPADRGRTAPDSLEQAGLPAAPSVEERAGAALSDDSRSLPDIEADLRAIVFPGRAAGEALPLYLDGEGFYANRRRVADPERLFAAVIEAFASRADLAGSMVSVLDFNLGDLNPPGLAEANIVNGLSPLCAREKLYHDLQGDSLPEALLLSREEKDRVIFEPMRERLADPGSRLLHVDHHYPGRSLSTVSTAVLMLDLVDYLARNGCHAELRRLSSSFAVADHSDADIVLANYARVNAADPRKLADVSELIKDTVLLNDYIREPAPGRAAEVKVLYDVLLSIEKRIASGRLRFGEAIDRVDEAIAFARAAAAAGFDEESLYASCSASGALPEVLASFPRVLLEDFSHGAADYLNDRDVLCGLTRSTGGEPLPGSVTKIGSMLFIYVPDGASEVKNACAVRYVRSECPELMEGVRVVVTSSPAPGWDEPRPRFVKLRSFIGADGRFLDLLPVFDRMRGGDLGPAFPAGGRSMAGALGKSPVRGLDLPEVSRMLAVAVEEEISRQGLSGNV